MQRGGGPAQSAVLDVDVWARESLARLAALPAVRRAGLALTEGGGRRHRFTASDRDPVPDWCHVDAYDDVPLNTAVRTGQPVLGRLVDLEDDFPGFVGRQHGSGTVAVGAVPMSSAGQVLGGFVLFFSRPQPFDAQQRRSLMALGRGLGHSLRRVQRTQPRHRSKLADEPVPSGAVAAVCEVPNELSAVGRARAFLRRTLASWHVDGATAETAVLCLSELVTNAVIHTYAPAEVRVVLEDGVLTTSVRDGGPGRPRTPGGHDDPLRVHGRGLELVDVLADRWGSEIDAVGSTMWFELEP